MLWTVVYGRMAEKRRGSVRESGERGRLPIASGKRCARNAPASFVTP